LLPADKLVPFTVRVAVAVDPLGINAAEPRDTPLTVKDTLPAGGFEPVTALTFAVSCVLALCAMLAGLAVSVKVVPIAVGRLAHLVTRL
jgi:hypothetical protein